MTDVPTVIELVDRGGVVALLIISLVVVTLAFTRGWVVTRREHDLLASDRDMWRDIALGVNDMAMVASEALAATRIEQQRQQRPGIGWRGRGHASR
jgi:hypothetical protein